MGLRVWFRTAVRLMSIIAGVSALAVLGLVVFHRIVDTDQLRSSSESLGTYIQTLGGIYAVLLAFVVVVVWQQFNEARGFINREANAVIDLYRIAGGLPDTAGDVIRAGLRDYVDGVLDEEWTAMTTHDERVIERVGHRLDRVWSAIHTCMPLNECQHIVYAEVLVRFNDLTELRTNRLVSASAKIPIAMNVLLYTGALIMIGSVYLLPFDRFWLHATVVGAFAGAVAHVLFLIWDLDDAFAGDHQVDRTPFVRARKALAQSDAPAAAA
jgi:Protein of unknown function (DUF4239)